MDQPIACTLTAERYRGRTQDVNALACRALRSREPLAGGVRLEFDAGAETERELRALVAAEAERCAFLRMEIRDGNDALILEVTGPADAQPIIAELFA